MSAETISSAQLQLDLLHYKSLYSFFNAQDVVNCDKNRELTAELNQLQESKKHDLEYQRAQHYDEMCNLRKDLHHKAIQFFMKTVLAEMDRVQVPQATINRFYGKRRDIEEKLGEIFKINERRPMAICRRRGIQQNPFLDNERRAERKRKHDHVINEDKTYRQYNAEKRRKLEEFIEEEKLRKADKYTAAHVEIDIPRYGDDQAEYREENEYRRNIDYTAAHVEVNIPRFGSEQAEYQEGDEYRANAYYPSEKENHYTDANVEIAISRFGEEQARYRKGDENRANDDYDSDIEIIYG